MSNSGEQFVKTELLKHLNGNMAFLPIPDMLEKIPFEKLGEQPYALPYSFYELFYHICYAQREIMNFMMADSYETPNWPDAYWPEKQAPEQEKDWEDLKATYFQDCQNLKLFLEEDSIVLSAPVKHSTKDDQNALREFLLILNHTAYHTGQLLIVLRLLGLHK